MKLKKTLHFNGYAQSAFLLIVALTMLPAVMAEESIKSGDQIRRANSSNPDDIYPAFREYRLKAEERIKRAWQPSKDGHPPTVSFSVDKDGKVLDLRITVSTGNKSGDDAALKAITDASPFGPLPTGVYRPLHATFDFNTNQSNGTARGGLNFFMLRPCAGTH